MIPKSTGGEFWQTVEVGAKTAAKDLGVNIKWEGSLVETEIADENKDYRKHGQSRRRRYRDGSDQSESDA